MCQVARTESAIKRRGSEEEEGPNEKEELRTGKLFPSRLAAVAALLFAPLLPFPPRLPRQ